MNQNFSLLSERHYYVDISPRITSREKKILLYVFETYKKYRKNPVKISSEKISTILNAEKKDLNVFLEKLSKKIDQKKYFWKSGALEVQFSNDMRGGDYGIREQGRFSSLPLREDS